MKNRESSNKKILRGKISLPKPLFLVLKLMLIPLLILLSSMIIAFADGWDAGKPSHQTLYVDTLTSKTDSSSVNVADNFFVTGDITTLGRIGIGATSPAANIEARGNSIISTGPLSTIDDIHARTLTLGPRPDSSAIASLGFHVNDASRSAIELNNVLGGVLGFVNYNGAWPASPSPVYNMVITKNGNIGIGTLSPKEKLVIYGSNSRQVIGDSTIHTTLYPGYDTQTWSVLEIVKNSDPLSSSVNGAAGLVLTGNYPVMDPAWTGVGAISFVNRAAGTSDLRMAMLSSGSETGAPNIGDIRLWTSNSGSLTEKMRITASGKVGIGTTNPSGALDVRSSNIFFGVGTNPLDIGTVTVREDGVDSVVGIHSSGFGALYLGWDVSTDRGVIAVDDGIGGYGGGPGQDIAFITDASGNGADPFSTLTPKMIIKGNGNVGIGTTNPQARLDVAGDIKSSNVANTIWSKAYPTATGTYNIKTIFDTARSNGLVPGLYECVLRSSNPAHWTGRMFTASINYYISIPSWPHRIFNVIDIAAMPSGCSNGLMSFDGTTGDFNFDSGNCFQDIRLVCNRLD